MNSVLPHAILLLGPTGSGKTPLGELLENDGLAGKKCFHFDFGAQLRHYATMPTGLLSASEIETVKTSLRTGALLTDEQFSIAEKLLSGFIEKRQVRRNDLIILNGLPRHTGQAANLAEIVQMTGIVVLDCNAETVFERIRTDAGGDRSGRGDDTVEEVSRKLKIFDEKTRPLINYYKERGVQVIRISVDCDDSAARTLGKLVNHPATGSILAR